MQDISTNPQKNPRKLRPLERRLWSRVTKTDGGCWLWGGAVSPAGYGRIGGGGRKNNKVLLAHRVAYALTHGPITDGLLVCHTCDVRSCVNPGHLFIGTHKDNNQDASAKGRLKLRHVRRRAKLNACDIRNIRYEYRKGGLTQESLAVFYSVSTVCVQRILKGPSWEHLVAD